MKWHFPSCHLGPRATSGVLVAGLLALRGAVATGAEEESAAGRPVLARSDKLEKPFGLNRAFCDDLSESSLTVFSRRNPSKLNTRVRFPSPAPEGER